MKKWIALSLALVALGLYVSIAGKDASGDVPSAPTASGPDTNGHRGNPGSPDTSLDVPQHNPFEPFDPGPANSLVPYSALSPAEQRVVDRGRDISALTPTLNAFAAAAAQGAQGAAARAASEQLGVDNLGEQGVVP